MDDIDPWDQEFLKVDQGTLFELILVRDVPYMHTSEGHALLHTVRDMP